MCKSHAVAQRLLNIRRGFCFGTNSAFLRLLGGFNADGQKLNFIQKYQRLCMETVEVSIAMLLSAVTCKHQFLHRQFCPRGKGE